MPKILREYVIVEPVETLAALTALDVSSYSGAAISCFVRDAKATYMLDRTSTQTSDGVNVITPAAGAGRWFREVSRLEDFSVAGNGGVADTYTATFDERLTAYEDGQRVYFKADVVNTGASTLNIDGVGAKKILHPDGSEVDAGELPLDTYVHMIYNADADAPNGAFEMVTQPLLRSRQYWTADASDVLSADYPLNAFADNSIVKTDHVAGAATPARAIPHTDYQPEELVAAAGVADAYTASIDAGVTAYAAGLEINLLVNLTNTGASTINVNGIGVQNIVLADGSNPIAGDLLAGAVARLIYNGSEFQLINPVESAGGAPTDATYITQTPNGSLSNEQALSLLGSGLMKNTTGTGVISIATQGTDYYAPGGTDVAVADGGTGASTAAGARTNLGLVIGTDVQAYDATLQSLSGLGTAADKYAYTTGIDTWVEGDITAFGRSLIDDANATAARSTLGLVIGTDVQAYDATLQSISALGTAADLMLYTTGIDTWAETSLTAFARTLLDDANQPAMQTTLGLVPGTDVQAYDAGLQSFSALPTAADKYAYSTAVNTWAEGDITAFARTLLDDANATTARATLGLVIGTDVQAYDATLAALAAYNTNGFLVQTAADTFAGRSISGTANEIDVLNGDGVAAGPTIGIADDAVFPGSGANILASGLTASRPGAPTAGMIRYNTSLNSYEYYNGSTWQTFATGGTAAPVDAQYWVSTANGTLTNEVDLGALTTGLIKHTVAAGVSTPSTAVEGTDYWAPGGTDVAVADGGTGASTAAGARTNLGLVIGTDVQAYDATLQSISALGTAADKMLYTTALDTWAEADLTAFARTLLDDASAAAMRTTLGVAASSDVVLRDGTQVLTGTWDNSAGSFYIRIPEPVVAADAATKNYVDTATAGQGAFWTPVRVETQAELSATYNNGAGTLTATANGAITIDSIALSLNDRVLVDKQTTGSTEYENGLYYVSTVGDVSNPYVLTRVLDADASSEFTTNKTVFVEDGTCTGCVFAYDGPDSPTLGTTAIGFTVKETAASVADGSITTAKLANSAVTAVKIADGAVENAKLADATLKSIANLGTAADKMIYTTAIDTWAEADLTSFARTLLDDANSTAARATLGVVIGTDVQAYDATLQSISALGTAADKIIYTTGIDTWAESDISAFGRSLIDDADASAARTTLGLGTMATQNASAVAITGGTITGTTITVADTAFTMQDNADATKQVVFELSGLTTATTRTYTAPDASGTLALTADLSAYQPLNSNLTDISGLAVTDGNFIVGNGANFVAESGATARASLGLTIGTDVQAYDATLQSLSALGTAADKFAYTTGIDTWAEADITAFGRSLVDDANAAAARTTLGLVIGTDVQAYDAGLASIAGLVTAADEMIYTTALDTYATTSLTAFARTLLDDTTATQARSTLGLVIGTNVQAWDAQLDDIAGLTPADGAFIVGDGVNFITESGATARTSLGLGTMATQNASSVAITGGTINGTSITVADNVFTIQDNVDPTKQALFEASGISTATTQTFTLPDNSGTVALISDLTSGYQPLNSNLTDISGLAVTDGNIIVGDGANFVAESGATARASLGLTIGTNVQAWDAGLDDIAALAVTDGNIIVGNGVNWVAESGATARASLGLTIGTDVQAWDAQLDDVAGLTPADGAFIVGDGANFVTETGATARTSLGLGTIATQDANNVAITGGSITGSTVTVADSSFTIQDNADATKQVVFEANGLTTGTTRTLTVQDSDGTIAYTADVNLKDNGSSGLVSGGQLSVNGVNPAQFDITAGSGFIVDDSTPATPVVTNVTIAGSTGNAVTNIATQDNTYILINSAGSIIQQATPPTLKQYRTTIPIGLLSHPNRTSITSVNIFINPRGSQSLQSLDLLKTLGPIKRSGNVVSANGANLQFDRSAGESLLLGRNFYNDPQNPNVTTDSADTGVGFVYSYQDGGGGFTIVTGQTQIDPANYDDGSGTLASVSANDWSNQRYYYFPSSGADLVAYGQTMYGSKQEALNGISTETHVESEDAQQGAIFVGYITVRGGATDLSDSADAAFTQAGLFRSSGSSGGTASARNEFSDANFRIFDDSDNTKLIAFEASNITTATTRTYTLPDESGTLALVTDLASTKDLKTQASHGFTGGEALYFNGTNWVEAQANSIYTSEVVGFVEYGTTTTNTFYLVKGGLMGGFSGLTAGEFYFLSPSSAGGITSTAPTNGQVKKPIGQAVSTTEIEINIMLGVLQSEGTSGSALYYTTLSGKSEVVIDNTILTDDFDYYEVEIVNGRVGTNSVYLYAQTSSDGGSTWDNGASDYQYAVHNASSGTSNNIGGAVSQVFLSNLLPNTSDASFNSTLTIRDPLNAALDTQVGYKTFFTDIAGDQASYMGSFRRNGSGQADNAIRIYPGSGTFAGGVMIVRGYKNSDIAIPSTAYDLPFIAGFDGTATAEDIAVQDYGQAVVARDGRFVGASGYMDTAPTGSAAIVDIEKNGTTIFDTKPQFAAGSNTMTAGVLKSDGTANFVDGDRITFSVTQIGSTTAGQGLRFTIKGEI